MPLEVIEGLVLYLAGVGSGILASLFVALLLGKAMEYAEREAH